MIAADDFDSHTHYLKVPPPFKYPTFSEFSEYYCQFEQKKAVLGLLVDYCNNVRAAGISPVCIVLGGAFLRKANAPPLIKLVCCLSNSEKITQKAISAHFTPIGEAAARYRGVIEPKAMVRIAAQPSEDVLISIAPIADLQKDHALDNAFAKVGLVCLAFAEVLHENS